jgi:transcriptional regulator with XRE-family HTH domain
MVAKRSQSTRRGSGGSESPGQRVVALRNARGWKQEQLAERVGISKSFLSEIENDHALPGGEIVMGLAETLGTTTDYILRGPRDAPDEVSLEPIAIPPELSALAEELNLSYSATRALLDARRYVLFRRGQGPVPKWNKDEWKKLHDKLKDYLG